MQSKKYGILLFRLLRIKIVLALPAGLAFQQIKWQSNHPALRYILGNVFGVINAFYFSLVLTLKLLFLVFFLS